MFDVPALEGFLYGAGWELRPDGIAVPPGTTAELHRRRIARYAANLREQNQRVIDLFTPPDLRRPEARPAWYDHVGVDRDGPLPFVEPGDVFGL